MAAFRKKDLFYRNENPMVSFKLKVRREKKYREESNVL